MGEESIQLWYPTNKIRYGTTIIKGFSFCFSKVEGLGVDCLPQKCCIISMSRSYAMIMPMETGYKICRQR